MVRGRHLIAFIFVLSLVVFVHEFGPPTAEQMTPEERAFSFFAQPVYQRAAIVVAGPLANFLLTVTLLTWIFYFEGRTVVRPIIAEVAMAGAADLAGFRKGDLILYNNRQKIVAFEDVQRAVQAANDQILDVVVERKPKC
jgi:regulator of sigma E protease